MNEDDLKSHVRALLAHFDDLPEREGLYDTPRRWLDAMEEMTGGRHVDIEQLLTVGFDAGRYDEIVAVRNIHFVSLCEHHVLPFVGTASVAYLPAPDRLNAGSYRVVGLSKIPRLVDAFARRLQLQERLTAQIAGALNQYLQPRGVAVIVRAEHSCAALRGVRKQGMEMVTSVMSGLFKENPEARAEVLQLLGGLK